MTKKETREMLINNGVFYLNGKGMDDVSTENILTHEPFKSMFRGLLLQKKQIAWAGEDVIVDIIKEIDSNYSLNDKDVKLQFIKQKMKDFRDLFGNELLGSHQIDNCKDIFDCNELINKHMQHIEDSANDAVRSMENWTREIGAY